jgi:ADP-ribose pyrophosphatase YjhB (NUDIX family)
MSQIISYCPHCGARAFDAVSDKAWRCSSCDFLWYQNTAAAAAAIIVHAGDILFAVRAGEPQAGKLDLPGGFVDNDETAEASLSRELEEELGLTDVRPRYLTSFPNTYPYAGVEYKTLDLIYLVELEQRPSLRPADDVAGIRWISAAAVPFADIAFESVRLALRYFLSNRRTLLPV